METDVQIEGSFGPFLSVS